MRNQQRNKIRAFVLLTVFSLNTVAGFACSIGVDMGYNSKHHAQEKSHSHHHDTTHHKHHHHHPFQGVAIKASGTDDCCSNDVAKFTLLDKSVVHSYADIQTPVFLIIYLLPEPVVAVNETVHSSNSRFQFVRRSCFVNDTDIRIAIQSFTI